MSVQLDTGAQMGAVEASERYGAGLVELEAVRYALIEAARDMHDALMRGAFSPVVRDAMDCTACIHMRTDAGWEMVASHEGCMQHAFTSQHIANFVMSEWDEASLRRGDTILTNDPWRGSVHQCDINILRPVFVNGSLEFVLHSTSHVIDLGGSILGGLANGVETSFEEQLKFAPTLLYSEDVPVRSTFDNLLENVRVPGSLLGDIRALYGCLVIGEKRIDELVERYGSRVLNAGGRYGLDVTERSMRSGISRLADGDYRVEDQLDEDGITDDPVPLVATVKIRGDSIEVDYSGTGRQPRGNVGTPWCESSRCVQGIKMLVDPASPVNSGTLRPVEALLPPGSAVCVLPPSSVSSHIDIGLRIVNMTAQAVGEASESRSIGADAGNLGATLPGGVDSRPSHEGNPWGAVLLPGGGWGGTWKDDGVSFCPASIANCRTSVWEHVEEESPLIILQHEMMPDSAGAGMHRGGFGSVYTMYALSETIVSVSGDRIRKGAQGMDGGGAGMPFYGWIVRGMDPRLALDPLYLGDSEPLFGMFEEDGRPAPDSGRFGAGARYRTGKFSQLILEPGQSLKVVVGGGGGWGDPLKRDTGRVLKDMRNGLQTEEFARAAYGVVTVDGTVDEDETERLRSRLRTLRDVGEWRVPTACPIGWTLSGQR